MNSYRFTASGRAGFWDNETENGCHFIDDLSQILREVSHAVVESTSFDFAFTQDTALQNLLAIIDKITIRGNPALVDYDYEKFLIKQKLEPYFILEENENSLKVGQKISETRSSISYQNLLEATRDLLKIPFSSDLEKNERMRSWRQDLHEISSDEEEMFINNFQKFFGKWLGLQLQRQIFIRDLVGKTDPNLASSKVDFAIKMGGLRWVIEVDGEQHREKGQQELDEMRNHLLREKGWDIWRLSAKDAREGASSVLERMKAKLPSSILLPKYSSVTEAVNSSSIHACAYESIIKPSAIHRCLRGLIQLYFFGALSETRKQRILGLEEDIPVIREAFRQLFSIWNQLKNLAPEIPDLPEIELDIIEKSKEDGPSVDFSNRKIECPDGEYDLVISHAFFLPSGISGGIESQIRFQNQQKYVWFRNAIGDRQERTLQNCTGYSYQLSELESYLLGKTQKDSCEIIEQQIKALEFFLRLIFRKKQFWDGQLRVISRLLQGRSAIALLPTGGGKSLTYQLSGLLLPGMTIIIDPLVALMQDQVDNLNLIEIDMTGFIASFQDAQEKNDVIFEMTDGKLSFVFVSPERLQMREFRESLQILAARLPISLAVIDEAHCISEWGHDFRPSYLHLPINLQKNCASKNKKTPILVGLTGTASFAVLTDIQTQMKITEEEAIVLPRTFDRKELQFNVLNTPIMNKSAKLRSLRNEIPRIFNSNNQTFFELKGEKTNCGIIFCPHVNGSHGVVEIAASLQHNNYFAGSAPFNFRQNLHEWSVHKMRVQTQFKKNKIQEIVATKAFGMGIDKPNVRYTIHYGLPQSVESFYQEAGRAGRNGKQGYAKCVIVYSDDNWDSAQEILDEKNHEIAKRKLDRIQWNSRGDLLVQLWLLLNSYQGREAEKAAILNFWEKHLKIIFSNMRQGATNTIEVRFRNSDKNEIEKSIFRFVLLGIVQDYSINWNLHVFSILVKKIESEDIIKNLKRYFLQYKFSDFADVKISSISKANFDSSLSESISVLIDFIYDEIVVKRKQAMRTMGEICRGFQDDESFRGSLLSYLQESEFSKELRGWLKKPFGEIGINGIRKILNRVLDLEEIKRLIGTSRRMLDEEPQNIALRTLSLKARAKSLVESDSSVVQELKTLLADMSRNQEEIYHKDELLIFLLEGNVSTRSNLCEEMGELIFRRFGSPALARKILKTDVIKNKPLYIRCLQFLTIGILGIGKKWVLGENYGVESQNV